VAENVLARLAVELRANTAQFNAALKQSEKQFQAFTGGITRAAGTLGVGLGASALVGVIGDAVNSMKEFQQQMKTVQAITNATDVEFTKLNDSALKLGGTTQFTAKQVAELQTEFGRLGFSVSEILNATEATVDLATATGEDLAKSADTAGSTIRGFGLDASETRRVVDVMAESFNRSALGLSNFTEAMKYVAPIAKSANLTVEETTALLGTLADAGIRGSQAGTSLRKIITDLAKDGRPLAVRLKELADRGLSFAQANDEVGRTAYASLLVLTQNQQKTEALTKALNNAEGAAKRTADIVGDTLAGDLKELSGSYDAVIQGQGEVTGSIRTVVQSLTDLVRAFNDQNSIIGKAVGLWIDLNTVVLRTYASIAKGLSQDIPLEEALENVNGLLSKIRNPDKDTLQKYLDGLAEIADRTGKKLIVLRDEFGKVQVFIKNNPIKTIVDPNNDGEINATIETIQLLEEKVKKFRRLQEEETSTGDIIGLRNLQKQIDDTLLKIEVIRNKIAGVRDEVFGASTVLSNISVNVTGELVLDESSSDSDILAFLTGKGKGEQAFSIPPVDAQDLIDSLEFADINLTNFLGSTREKMIDFSGIVSNALSGLGQALGRAISGSQDLGEALLSVLGNVLVQLGEMVLTAGIGVEAFKASLESLNGYVAIAAGIALIALGSAITSSISSMGADPTGGGSSRSGGSRGSTAGGIGQGGFEIKIGGEFRIQGPDLVLVINRQQQLSDRTTG
jgi:hypothetical protein